MLRLSLINFTSGSGRLEKADEDFKKQHGQLPQLNQQSQFEIIFIVILKLTLGNARVFIFDILTFETLETDFKRFNPDWCVSPKKHFHSNTTIFRYKTDAAD